MTIGIKEKHMPWIPWIHTETETTSNEEVQQLYRKTRNPLTNKISDITRLNSLTPNVSSLLDDLRAAVYQNKSGLTAREKEIAALVTSSFNGCVH
jgi:alkylhydroperoxidase family enzyme